ncbi:MAG: hypothetical protein WBC97_02760 [Gemmatimonadales bacterium]
MALPDLIPLFAVPLGRAGIAYMVTGSVAASLYGELRFTQDVDLVVALKHGDPKRLEAAFPAKDFYVPPLETMVEEAARPRYGHFNLFHLESGLRADVYLMGDDPLHAWAFTRRREVEIAGELVSVAPLEYNIVRKLEFYRDGGSQRHLRDIAWMLRVSEKLIDLPLLEAKVLEQGVEREWAEAQRTPLDA